MKKLWRGLLWAMVPVGIVAALAGAAPFFVPVASYLPELAAIASAKLGQPVSIDDLSFQLLPTPRMIASGIVIGKRGDARVGELEIVPELMAFLEGERRLRRIRAEDVQLKESALSIPASMPKGGAGQTVVIQRLLLQNVAIQHSTLRLPLL